MAQPLARLQRQRVTSRPCTSSQCRCVTSTVGAEEIGSVTGIANINLAGTPFALAEEAQFNFAGPDVVGNSEIDAARISATLTVTGNCGWVIPASQIPLAYIGPTQASNGQ